MKNSWKYYLTILIVILLDQALKLYAHFKIYALEVPPISLLGDLLKLTYILNSGMAFGISLGFKYGKLLLTTIRIIASGLILRHIIQLIRTKEVVTWWIWGWSLVLGGAIGNSIDSMFYGIFFNNAPHDAPTAWGNGQVIDMIHVDIWTGTLPKWFPLLGGEPIYCLPVFNLADVAIFLGLIIVLIIKGPHHPTIEITTIAQNDKNGSITPKI